jgi:hypothetical protein
MFERIGPDNNSRQSAIKICLQSIKTGEIESEL